ncbi:Hvo_1808 family surface protein [Haloarchaeobius sp. HME9146]|uniref:Hvo_1808 family surface protein n=1 Tax=Haloarchaeobius sp. HME9146 TaxID=2978732 RepID=UPI0021BE6CDB|nr:Hvo_1808 family surface protein [Haloarchaeobius sp. HME9146]
MKAKAIQTVTVVTLVLLAGCFGFFGSDDGTGVGDDTGPFADPATDRIGWENGYWYNESIDVDQSDGISEAEQEAFLARSMARVEVLRNLEFKEPVTVSVITREQQRANSANGSTDSESKNRWNDQVWEALFISDEQKNIEDEFGSVTGSAVLGYYAAGTNKVVMVSDDPDRLVINNATFVHELTHALQDQHFDIKRVQNQAKTQDQQLAANGLIEGEADYIEALYLERCTSGEWSCVKTPGTESSGGSSDMNLGILVTIFQPYSDGPWYVHQLVQDGGWERVNNLWVNPPQTSSALIHPDREFTPVEVTIEDQARNGWQTFEHGTDTVGEASIYSMFWYQSRQYNISTINTSTFSTPSGIYDRFDYRSPPSAGWVGDAVLPYQNSDGEYGHVFVTEWATPADATEFRQAYQTILAGHGGSEQSPGIWVIPDGGFADAFRIHQTGTTVTIVNGPTVDDLDDIRP